MRLEDELGDPYEVTGSVPDSASVEIELDIVLDDTLPAPDASLVGSPLVTICDAPDEDEAAAELAELIAAAGVVAPYLVTSPYGRRLAHLLEPRAVESPVEGANQRWAAGLGRRAQRLECDAIVAVGGGRCLDVGKLAAARSGLRIFTAPTQISHDGVCSPVAVVPRWSAHAESVLAVAPEAVFFSLPTLMEAPVATVRAGIGDLLTNPYALRDWELAASLGLDVVNPAAWALSLEALELIDPLLELDVYENARDPRFIARLAHALVVSGMAMMHAGSSRPASGAEHKISHAIDSLLGGRALHGEQVALGSVVSAALYGDDRIALRARLESLGLPQHPAELTLQEDELVAVLLAAPGMRPGRFTIIDQAGLDEAGARALVRYIWGPW